MSSLRKLAIGVSLVSLLVGPSAQASLAREDGVSSTMVINATPPVVWDALQDPRSGEAFHRRVVSTSANSLVVEETFPGTPVLGAITCLISEENEEPCKHLDFCLLRSDKLKQFKGSWTLTPSADGKHTTITVITYCDSGSKIPFARNITNMTVAKNERVRLSGVKELAETMQHQIVTVASK